MSEYQAEIDWEARMIDNGVDKYHAAMDAARFVQAKAGGLRTQNDESATSYGVSMIREHFDAFEMAIDEFLTGAFSTRGRRDIAAGYIARMDVRTTAYIAAKCIIDTISITASQTELVFRIAGKIEDQMRLKRFSEDYPRYWKALLEDMQMRGVKNYRHKRKVLTHCHDKAVKNDDGRSWIAWPKADKVHIGLRLLDLFMISTGLVERVNKRHGNKTSYLIVGTDYAINLIEQNMELFQYLHPEFMPTLIQPKDWTTPWDGGYHSEELRRRRPLVKVRGYCRKEHSAALQRAEMPVVYDAVNAAQAVAWRVNEFVLEQAEAEVRARGIGCPVGMNVPAPESPVPMPERGKLNDAQYGAMLEGIRNNLTPDEQDQLAVWRGAMRDWHQRRISNRGKMLGVANTYKIARLMANHERFYYVHSLDSRGRLYPCGVHLTPQGTGMAKGLLEFADGVSLGRYGYWHLALHAAGVFGVDKVSLEDRVAWIHEHSREIIDCWENPAGARDFWGAADKPYMFLAACRELAEIWVLTSDKMLTIVNKSGLEWAAKDFVSHLPCAQDGSCNGIQHFTAMLLDTIGAEAVNMTAADDTQAPSDIYGATAQLVVKMIKEDLASGQLFVGKEHKAMLEDERAMLYVWLSRLGVDRKLCKRSTMIIPYGGQKSSCLTDVGDVLQEKLEHLQREGKGLDWSSRQAYQAAWIMHNYVWKALDHIVVAARRAMKFLSRIATVQIRTGEPLQWTSPIGYPCFQDYKNAKPVTVDTMICGRMQVKYLESTDELDKARMRNAFPPNFVHSMDATHLMKTVTAALDMGISQFALVHDSYGVPAGLCEGFHKVIRAQFIDLYSIDRLWMLRKEQQKRNPGRAEEYPGLDEVLPGEFDIEEIANAPYFFR